jgi:ketosteroid isomerase-like protein
MTLNVRALAASTGVLASCLAGPGAKAEDARPTPDQQALIKAEAEWIAAETRRDAPALRELLDDRFVATMGGGEPVDKATFIRNETQSPPDPTASQEISDRRIIVAGNTAVITETDTLRRTRDGKASVLTWRFTVTYIKRGGRWLALAEQGGPAKP